MEATHHHAGFVGLLAIGKRSADELGGFAKLGHLEVSGLTLRNGVEQLRVGGHRHERRVESDLRRFVLELPREVFSQHSGIVGLIAAVFDVCQPVACAVQGGAVSAGAGES